MIRCCYKCEERTATCHSTCKKYIDEQAAHVEECCKALEVRKEDLIMGSYALQVRTKYYRRHRNREIVKFNRVY